MIFRNDMTSEQIEIKGKKIHFIGIGGVSMSSIAIMAHEQGAVVTGCDLQENDGTAACREAGIPVEIGHSPDHVNDVHMIVYSSAVPQHNLEIKNALERKVIFVPRAVMLARLLKENESIGVAGSHGKTTTTYMVAQLFSDAGMDPSVMVGGRVNEWHSNFHLGHGKHFITEVDESDGSLLFLRQKNTIITNIDRDHLDFYRDIEHIQEVFLKYAENTMGGEIVACGDNKPLREALMDCTRKVTWYGEAPENDARPVNIRTASLGREFDLVIRDAKIGTFHCALLGGHNMLNCVAALTMGHLLGLDSRKMASTTDRFRGVLRRQDALGERNGVKVVDDYAHHPTEIYETIKALRELRAQRMVIVFQPHRYTRTAALYAELAQSLTGADYVILADIYPANEEPITGVSSNLIARELSVLGYRNYQYIPKKDLILSHLSATCKPGDLVVTMGAGDIRKLGEKFLEGA
ncbi:MAG: UDP-N-acetylmuramate--L-alanine ligase [Candidatus Brocadiia bacterium]